VRNPSCSIPPPNPPPYPATNAPIRPALYNVKAQRDSAQWLLASNDVRFVLVLSGENRRRPALDALIEPG
jgi:hypothetical protein